MDKLEAKNLSIKLWEALSENGSISCKEAVPFFNEIKDLENYCPLCEIFSKPEKENDCEGCPLNIRFPHNSCAGGRYIKWLWIDDKEKREVFAKEILSLIEAWEVHEDD